MAESKKYQKLTQREHVLQRPGMYVGSTEAQESTLWTPALGEVPMRFEKRAVTYVPGLLKIYDEILVNAVDHITRLAEAKAAGEADIKAVTEIRVKIDEETGEVEVYNSGNGIDVYRDEEHKMYIPELIFGNLLTSTNYQADQERVIGGMNGLGSKLTSIYSTRFEVETLDHVRRKLYKQTFEDNMSVTHPPTIKTSASKSPFTRITFMPDYARFGMKKGLTQDMFLLMKKRVYDMCACTPPTVKIFFQGEQLGYRDLDAYASLYLGDDKKARVSVKEDRWEVILADTPLDGFEQVSFVNACHTLYGGKHVEHVVTQVSKKLAEMIATKRKCPNVKPANVLPHLFVMIKATIVNPTFDGQTKERLTTPIPKFGSKWTVSDKDILKLYKVTEIADKVTAITHAVTDKKMEATDGKKRNTLRGIPKLQDAIWAGGPKSDQATLILCEGDSAATFCTSGLAVVGREKYGVYPLRGKLLNVKDCARDKLADNKEIQELKKILGLESGKSYASVSSLRYGRIMILTDSDVDGSHIKGLLINLFESLWPSLFQTEGFLTTMQTPIVKVKRGGMELPFYNLPEFEEWLEEQTAAQRRTADIKYYKGLGTSTANEARDAFRAFKTNLYRYDSEKSKESIDLAFNKKRADDRKTWIGGYDRSQVLKGSDAIEFSEFVHKDLIHFSVYNLERAIPSLMDGFKRTLRKIYFACVKRKLTKEVKVAQLAGYISEHAAYHHGESSLQDAIVGMAQNFVGSNNINLLVPNGQFGTRIMGGKDAASPRYIFTYMNPIAETIFPSADHGILQYLDDDGVMIEPEQYYPILPMVLVNGAAGIATGYSTNIPCYDPREIVSRLRVKLTGDTVADTANRAQDMQPWYLGYTGEIFKKQKAWHSRGRFEVVDAKTVDIVELPLFSWTDDYKMFLEDFIGKHPKILRDYENQYTDRIVRFRLHFASADALQKLLSTQDTKLDLPIFYEKFNLVSSRGLTTTNMHLFNPKMQIRRYQTAQEILDEYYEVRLQQYEARKRYLLAALTDDLKWLSSRAAFILAVIEGKCKVANVSRASIVEWLKANRFALREDSYDYLIKMPIYNLTLEKKEELLKETEDKKALIANMQATPPEKMWLTDLATFEKAYQTFLATYEKEVVDAHKQGPSGSGSKKTPKTPKKLRVPESA